MNKSFHEIAKRAHAKAGRVDPDKTSERRRRARLADANTNTRHPKAWLQREDQALRNADYHWDRMHDNDRDYSRPYEP